MLQLDNVRFVMQSQSIHQMSSPWSKNCRSVASLHSYVRIATEILCSRYFTAATLALRYTFVLLHTRLGGRLSGMTVIFPLATIGNVYP